MHLSELARTHGAKAAVIDGSTGEALSFAELEEASNRIARAFEGLGLRRGDHVAILAENTLDLFPVVWAAQRSGLLSRRSTGTLPQTRRRTSSRTARPGSCCTRSGWRSLPVSSLRPCRWSTGS